MFFAFTKANPFSSKYELVAYFESANNLAEKSPVRIAGIEVGKVKKVESKGRWVGGSRRSRWRSTTAASRQARLPLKVRSRLFLEGNLLVDLQPGTPSAKELPSGGTPIRSRPRSPCSSARCSSAPVDTART